MLNQVHFHQHIFQEWTEILTCRSNFKIGEMVSPIYEYTSETYINVSLFQICVEDKDKEDEIDAEGEDGHNNQEDNKMNRIMEHCPEAQPAIPT